MPKDISQTFDRMIIEAVMGKQQDQTFNPKLPPVRRALLEQLHYKFIEAPWRHMKMEQLRKAIESQYLQVQKKVHEAELQGAAINPSLDLYGGYNNINGVVDPTQITFDQLRDLVARCPPLGAIVSKRVEQVAAFARIRHSHVGRSADSGFQVRMTRREDKPTSEDKSNMSLLEEMILNSGFTPPPEEETPLGWQPGFDQFLRAGTRDLLTMDWIAVRMWASDIDPKKYPVVAFACVDAARIRRVRRKFIGIEDGVAVTVPRESERTTTRKEIVTIRVGESNMPTDEFTKDELFTGCRRPRTDDNVFGYGYSEAEEIVDVATSWVNGLKHNATRFTNDNIPRGILTLLGNSSQAQVDAFAEQWSEMLAGTGNSWRVPVFRAAPQQGSQVNWTPLDMSPKDMEYSQFMSILSIVCHAAYNIHPEETGYAATNPFRPPLSESSPEARLRYSQDTGLHPILKWWESFINRTIIWRMFPSRRYTFNFVGLGDWDEMLDTQMRTARMSAGITTPEMEWNELDIEMPEEIRNHPASKMPGLWPANYQLLQAAQQQDQAAQQQQEQHSASLQSQEAATETQRAQTQQLQTQPTPPTPQAAGANPASETPANRAAADQTRQALPNPADRHTNMKRIE